MTLHATKLKRILVFSMLVFSVAVVICYCIGVRINVTPSIPLGLYVTVKQPITKGDYVEFCPPVEEPFILAQKRGYIAYGFCPGRFGKLMKKVVGVTGDQVVMTHAGIRINNEHVPFSKPRLADASGRTLPKIYPQQFKMQKSELLLMSDTTDTSFDSRYFGVINKSNVLNVIKPLYTWGAP